MKYNVNHYFFNEYSKSAAYWAGFLAADGNIGKAKDGVYKRIRLYLGIQDVGHLHKYKEAIMSEHKVKEDFNYNRCSFEYYSLQTAQDLNALYNITPQKSLTYMPPYDIPLEYEKYFIRGYFDGDGCISECWTNKNSKTASLVTTCLGTEPFMYWFLNSVETAINKQINIELQQHSNNKNTMIIKFNTNLSKDFLFWLYKNADNSLRLERKYQLYKKVVINNDRKTR